MTLDADLPTRAAAAGASDATEAPAGLGRTLFERRRWIIPPFVLAAFALGGATAGGRAAGGALLAAALVLHVAACRHIGGASRVHVRKAGRRRVLVRSGPFARLRNPIYAGNALGAAGICLALGPAWFAAAAFVGVLALYDRIVAWEEALLAGLYGAAYSDYRSAVPRWLPSGSWPKLVGDAVDAGRQPLGKTLRRERGTFVLAGIAVVLAALRPWLGGPLL
jgi:protein-S-isoprenylcysteine O-methyltransferase Ste14